VAESCDADADKPITLINIRHHPRTGCALATDTKAHGIFAALAGLKGSVGIERVMEPISHNHSARDPLTVAAGEFRMLM